MRWFVAPALVLTLALGAHAACSSSKLQQVPCSTDSDCARDEVCTTGQCVIRRPGPDAGEPKDAAASDSIILARDAMAVDAGEMQVDASELPDAGAVDGSV